MAEKLFLRRGEARERLGLSREGFAKLVAAGALRARYFPGQARAYFDAKEVGKVQPEERTSNVQLSTSNVERGRKK